MIANQVISKVRDECHPLQWPKEEMNFVSIAGIMLATTVVGRVTFLFLQSRAKYRRRKRRSG